MQKPLYQHPIFIPISIVVLWISIVIYSIVSNEILEASLQTINIIATGREDRRPIRGNIIRLSYPFSKILCQDISPYTKQCRNNVFMEEKPIYIVFKKIEGTDLMRMSGVFLNKPSGSKYFLQGSIFRVTKDTLYIDYGINSYLLSPEESTQLKGVKSFRVTIGVNEEGKGRVKAVREEK